MSALWWCTYTLFPAHRAPSACRACISAAACLPDLVRHRSLRPSIVISEGPVESLSRPSRTLDRGPSLSRTMQGDSIRVSRERAALAPEALHASPPSTA
ncbi:hypothetical protein FB451DRAFT_1395578 [Mycena latifolia]|nr:hypothetical protein FB451DRAFT_1395578 [Mycena latifolia]